MRMGLIGCGSIAGVIASHADRSGKMELAWLYDIVPGKAQKLSEKLKSDPKVAEKVSDMKDCDLVIEAASQEAVRRHALDVLGSSDLMILSVGALSDDALLSNIAQKAEREKRKVYIPSGALAGLDAVKAGNMSDIKTVTLTMRKSPRGLEGAPWVAKSGINLKTIKKPEVIFEGSARQAAEGFPKNVNVSIALSLAGIGADETRVKVIADPLTDKNTHEVEAEGRFGILHCSTENVHFPGNPKTSYLAALSAIRMLENITGSLMVGT